MKILGIETSCDETGAAIIEAYKNAWKVNLLSNTVASSLSLHAKTGGIIPEIAAREQVKYMIPVIEKSLGEIKVKDLDAIAVTVGPGLVGSLLIGVETAKTLAYVFDKPIIPVNHLIGHIYANFIRHDSIIKEQKTKNEEQNAEFPAIALIVSGGHTDLLLIKTHKNIKWLGGTRDDAAGEAFDKTGRLLGLPYPAGPQIEKLSAHAVEDGYRFPRPLIDSGDYDFSFSGLKTAVMREINKIEKLNDKTISNICFSLQQSIFDILISKTLKAAKEYKVKSILLGGGVSANQTLRKNFELAIKMEKMEAKLFIPDKKLCTDNAAMIASAAFYNYEEIPWQEIIADPELYFD